MDSAYDLALTKILAKKPMDDDQDDFELDTEDNDLDDGFTLAQAPSNSGRPPVQMPDWLKRGGLYPGT
ncbi:hypothetical protein [Leptospira johnsonii]|uniref:Uncharacterized protein n=1 Tax=Leptospira johnsonii TaxID=1917820 RepID=A0A2P2D7Y5_9LEPT|nr:hypothetical protein [Leptospira johnsonii]GBF40691.1 hypothetical protein LPTSP1_37090 [Leptospira johnsonii]